MDSLRGSEEAFDELRLSVHYPPEDPDARYKLANVLWSVHDLPGALAEFDLALKFKPDCEPAQYH